MKKLQLLFLFIYLLLAVTVNSQVYEQGKAGLILKSAAAKLSSLGNVSYKYRRESIYKDDNYHGIYNAVVFFNFNNPGSDIKFLFQSDDDKYFSCYNGSQYFSLDKKNKTIAIQQKPGENVFESLSPLYNSLVSLRAIFPLLIKSDAIKKVLTDTVINNESFYRLRFELYDHFLGNLGNVENFTANYTGDRTKPYEIIFSKRTFLPYQYITKFKGRKDDLIAASFLDIDTDPGVPAELSWFYSTYTNEYEAPKPKKPLVGLTTELANWVLPAYDPKKTDSVSLNQYKGKIVMLDFWIKTCGPCLASFPYLNELQQKFGAGKFQMLSINTQDSKEDIAFFYKKHKPVYKMLFAGDNLVGQYGISSYPTCIILDKAGKVIYAGGFDKVKIEKLVAQNL